MEKKSWLQRVFSASPPEEHPLVAPEKVSQRKHLMESLEIKARIASELDRTLAQPPVDPFNNLWSNWQDDEIKKSAMDASSAVYACVTRYMMAQRSVKWVLRKVEKGKPSLAVDHPVSRLLRYPNKKMSMRRMLDRVTLDLLHDGTAYWQEGKVRESRPGERKADVTKELNHIDSGRVVEIPDKQEFVDSYLVFDNAAEARSFRYAVQSGNVVDPMAYKKVGVTRIPADSMIVFIMESACSVYRGKGPIEAGRRLIQADSNALTWWSNQIKKGVRKAGILSFTHDYSEQETDDADRLLHRDVMGPQNVGGILLMGQSHTYTPLDNTPNELDYGKSRQDIRREIAALFAVPPPMIGDFTSSTYNNMQIARMIFWLDTMIPFLEILKDALNFYLLNREIPESEWDMYEIDYDLSGVEALLQVFGTRLDHGLKLRKLGTPLRDIFTITQIQMPSFDGDEYGYLEKNLSPLKHLDVPQVTRNKPGDPAGLEPSHLVKDPKLGAAHPDESIPGQGNISEKPRGNALERRSL